MSVKKLLSVLFSASIISLSTMAQNGDNAITPIEPSLNTDGDTYIIESAENMHWINENWKTIADKKFKIIDNRTINLDSWFSNIALTTEFDGNGATIKFNSTGTSDDYVTVTPTGLFEKIIEGATVSNLNIVGEIYNPSSDGDDLGILCNCLIIDDENTSPVTLRNITTDGSIKTRGMNAGGIAGSTTASVYMQNIINKASIEASCYVGGILGQVNKYAQSVELNSVANIGLLKMTDPLFNIPNIYPAIGGIIGFIEQYINEESSPVMLTDISSRGSIIVTSTKDVDITSMDNSVCIFVGNTGRGITFKNICAIFYGQIDNGNGEIIEAGLYSFEKRVHFEYGCPWVGWGESEPGIIYEGKNYSYYTDENGNIVSGCNPLEDFQNCQITYFLNNELEEEKSSWRQSPDGYPILAIEGGGDLVYKHGNTYNTMPHAYNEEGYCQGGEGCYEHPNFTNDGIIISNAGQLRWLNENFYSEEMSNYRYSNIHFGAVFIAPRSTSNQGPNLIPVTIDLTNGDPNNNNWISNINVYANVYGHGSTINFVSCSYDPKTPVTGLFNMIGGEYEQSEQYSELTINDLNIYGTIYSNNQLGDPVGNYIGLLANAARCNINTRIENIKLYNYIDESIDAPSGISTSIPAQGSLIGEACGSQCTVYLSNIVSEVNINGSMRMGGLLGSGQNVNISYSTYKGTMNYSSDLIFEGWQGEYSMGGLIGYASGNININYCYTSAPMYNYERDDVYMGTYIGTRDKYDENDQTTLEFCYAYYVNEELEPTNYSYLAVNPIGYIKETEAPYILNSEKVTRPQSEREAENIVTYNYDNGIFHYFPSIDKYQKNVVLNYFNRGEVLGVIINNGGAGEDSRDMFSQNLGEIIPEEFESCPRLVFELGTNEDIYPVFNTCSKEPIYSNTDRRRKNEETGGFILDENKQYVYDHVFNPKTHLCIYCNAIDEDYFADNSEVIIEDTDDLTSMTDIVSTLTQEGIAADITVTNNIVYTDVEYSDLSTDALETILPDKQSIGTSEAPFKGTFNGESGDFVNFAFKQNGLFNYVGEEGTVSGLSIVNGVVLNDLSGEDVVKEDDGTIYAAALANVNEGNIEYSSFVGAMAIPDDIDQEKVNFCLVGENKGSVSYSFAYFTNLDEVKDKLNKAAIIIKGNYGVGRGTAGQTKKVASNSASNSAITDDPYYTPSDSELTKGERTFSNEEFASGVVAYWMNFEDEGYQGTYTCKYRQGVLTPELSNNGEDAVHKIIYQSNKSTATVTGKAYENSGSTLIITLSEPAQSVKIGDTEAVLTADNTRATINVPVTTEADVTVNVTFAGATAIDTITPDAKANVVVADGRLMVFGAEGQNITVFNTNGNIVYSAVVTSNRVDLPVISRGIYFVKVGNHTTKIVF